MIAIFISTIALLAVIVGMVDDFLQKKAKRKSDADYIKRMFDRKEKEDAIDELKNIMCPPTTENLSRGCRYPNCNCGPFPGSHAD